MKRTIWITRNNEIKINNTYNTIDDAFNAIKQYITQIETMRSTNTIFKIAINSIVMTITFHDEEELFNIEIK